MLLQKGLCCILPFFADYIFVNGNYSASLQSDFIKPKPFHEKSGLCLQFMYYLPNINFMPVLMVYQVMSSEKTLLWTTTGYHGKKWLEGRVSLQSKQASKVSSLIYIFYSYSKKIKIEVKTRARAQTQ